MKTLSTCLLAIGLFFILSNNTQAQYFNWVTGASGANHGGSIAIDDTGHVYVVGTIDTLDTLGPPQTAFGADSAQFNLFPNFTAQSSQYIAYVTKYQIDNYRPISSAFITTASNRPDSVCGGPDSVYGHQTVVTPSQVLSHG